MTKTIAIFELGGKQYLVSEGDIVFIDNFTEDLKEGDKFTIKDVLLVNKGDKSQIGSPHIKGAKIDCVVSGTGRSKKISVIKFKSKSRYFRNKGHRQDFTKLEVKKIG